MTQPIWPQHIIHAFTSALKTKFSEAAKLPLSERNNIGEMFLQVQKTTVEAKYHNKGTYPSTYVRYIGEARMRELQDHARALKLYWRGVSDTPKPASEAQETPQETPSTPPADTINEINSSLATTLVNALDAFIYDFEQLTLGKSRSEDYLKVALSYYASGEAFMEHLTHFSEQSGPATYVRMRVKDLTEVFTSDKVQSLNLNQLSDLSAFIEVLFELVQTTLGYYIRTNKGLRPRFDSLERSQREYYVRYHKAKAAHDVRTGGGQVLYPPTTPLPELDPAYVPLPTRSSASNPHHPHYQPPAPQVERSFMRQVQDAHLGLVPRPIATNALFEQACKHSQRLNAEIARYESRIGGMRDVVFETGEARTPASLEHVTLLNLLDRVSISHSSSAVQLGLWIEMAKAATQYLRQLNQQ